MPVNACAAFSISERFMYWFSSVSNPVKVLTNFLLLIFFYAISCQNTVQSALSALNCSHKTYGVSIDILVFAQARFLAHMFASSERVPAYDVLHRESGRLSAIRYFLAGLP